MTVKRNFAYILVKEYPRFPYIYYVVFFFRMGHLNLKAAKSSKQQQQQQQQQQ